MALSSTQVKLTWEASTDNVGVKDYVLRRNDVEFQTVDAPTLTFTDTNAVPGSGNKYRLVARDAAGNVSPLSTTAKANTPKS